MKTTSEIPSTFRNYSRNRRNSKTAIMLFSKWAIILDRLPLKKCRCLLRGPRLLLPLVKQSQIIYKNWANIIIHWPILHFWMFRSSKDWRTLARPWETSIILSLSKIKRLSSWRAKRRSWSSSKRKYCSKMQRSSMLSKNRYWSWRERSKGNSARSRRRGTMENLRHFCNIKISSLLKRQKKA